MKTVQLYKNMKTKKVYTMAQLKDAFDSFWYCIDGVSHWNFKPIKRPADAWERFLSALKIEKVG